jgi:hypothetical protein
MPKFVKKPVIIEAVQWTGNNKLEISEFVHDSERRYDFQGDALFIHTLEGSMRATKGDYIIKGVEGEFYPCKPEIFEKTYANSDAIGELSDGYHTYNELYDFRKMFNAALFNEWGRDRVQHPHWWKEGRPFYSYQHDVHKSKKHHDGELCFGGGWFIVVANLPTGQITNHYEMKDWDLFQIPEEPKALFEFDGHTGADVLTRLKELVCLKKQN